jgi:hypothetical protein
MGKYSATDSYKTVLTFISAFEIISSPLLKPMPLRKMSESGKGRDDQDTSNM